MKLYIPEIGDELILEKDWTFDLYPEDRNIELAAYFGHYLVNDLWVDSNVLEDMRPIDYKVNYTTEEEVNRTDWRKKYIHFCDAYDAANKEAENNNEKFVKYWSDYREFLKEVKNVGKSILRVIIPVGTPLKVDRIYIRKGNSDYSSITFFAKFKTTTTVNAKHFWRSVRNKKSLRFWAKLKDCNNIEFKQ